MDTVGILVQSGPFTGLRGGKHSEAEEAVVAYLTEHNVGRRTVQFRLRDWLISRQRYAQSDKQQLPLLPRNAYHREVR